MPVFVEGAVDLVAPADIEMCEQLRMGSRFRRRALGLLIAAVLIPYLGLEEICTQADSR
jgi:hypothetical protein